MRLDDTVLAWQSWSQLHQAYVGPWRDLVRHSGRVLQALLFQPTGAICAAATTSLPEVVGGVRNWDYRYAWVRDASFTIEALWVAACPDEANEVLDYTPRCSATSAWSTRPGRSPKPRPPVRHEVGGRPVCSLGQVLHHGAVGRSRARRSHPWNRDQSPASHASRSPGLPKSQSGRISLVAVRRSRQRSYTDGRPQNQ